MKRRATPSTAAGKTPRVSLRETIREMYGQGLTDAAIRARLSGTAAPEGIRSSMSVVRQELGIKMRPDLCGPRAARIGIRQRPVSVSFPKAVLARLDDEAACRGLTRSALTRQIVERALAAAAAGQEAI